MHTVRPIGAILVDLGSVDEKQLGEALALQRRVYRGVKLGEILIGLRHLERHQLKAALEVQAAEKWLGQILLGRGVISAPDLDRALADQQQNGIMLGITLIGLGYCTPDHIHEVHLVRQALHRSVLAS